MCNHYDLIVLGGGCAGLSLAMRLARQSEPNLRVLIVERRREYYDDRTWCFWGEGSPAIRHLIRYRWRSMRLQAHGRSLDVECHKTPYQMIPSGAFYDAALDAIEETGSISLLMATSLCEPPRKIDGQWQVKTNSGIFHAPFVIDTLPGEKPKPGGAVLWQSFYGHQVVTDDPVFDAERLGLMDFAESAPGQIQFTYVLPLSPYRALVESTVFAPVPIERRQLAESLDLALKQRVNGSPFRIERSESGILPMGAARSPKPRDETFVKVGLNGGGARPSTGYAFQRIQRWADDCANRLVRGETPVGHRPDPPLLRAMDYLFVSVLRARPDLGPSIFLSLFEKANTARLIRFMSDFGTLPDYANIISSLPVLPFLKELPQAVLQRAR